MPQFREAMQSVAFLLKAAQYERMLTPKGPSPEQREESSTTMRSDMSPRESLTRDTHNEWKYYSLEIWVLGLISYYIPHKELDMCGFSIVSYHTTWKIG